MASIDKSAPATSTQVFNPSTYDPSAFDEKTQRLLLATIDFFESRGKVALKEADHERRWYADFLDFVAREKVFATLLTPAAEGGDDPDKRWDTARICAFNEITAFYGLAVLVHVAGLHPRARTDLAERQRCRTGARGQAPRRGRDLRLRALREGARRRHLLDGHDPHARR